MREATDRKRATGTYLPRAARPGPAAAVVTLLLAQCAVSAAETTRAAPKAPPPATVCKEATGPGPADVVKALYHDYPFESLEVPEKEPLPILQQYFDDELAALFVKDRECTQKTRDLCKLSVTVLYAAQNSDIKDLRVCEPAPGSEWVEARFVNFGEPEVIRFQVKKTPRGWRVGDIWYGGDQTGLVKALSDP